MAIYKWYYYPRCGLSDLIDKSSPEVRQKMGLNFAGEEDQPYILGYWKTISELLAVEFGIDDNRGWTTKQRIQWEKAMTRAAVDEDYFAMLIMKDEYGKT